MSQKKYYGKTLLEWFEDYNNHFENNSFPAMEYSTTPAEKLVEMAKEAIETDTPIEIEYDPFIMY